MKISQCGTQLHIHSLRIQVVGSGSRVYKASDMLNRCLFHDTTNCIVTMSYILLTSSYTIGLIGVMLINSYRQERAITPSDWYDGRHRLRTTWNIFVRVLGQSPIKFHGYPGINRTTTGSYSSTWGYEKCSVIYYSNNSIPQARGAQEC